MRECLLVYEGVFGSSLRALGQHRRDSSHTSRDNPIALVSMSQHTGLTIYASRAYTRITLRVFCVMIPSRTKAAEPSAAFALTGAHSLFHRRMIVNVMSQSSPKL